MFFSKLNLIANSIGYTSAYTLVHIKTVVGTLINYKIHILPNSTIKYIEI